MELFENPIYPAKPWRLTTDAYHRMIEAAVFREDDHLELIEGLLVDMTPQGPPHARIVQRLTGLLVRGVGEKFAVRVQLPLTLGKHSEPEPDFAVVPASLEISREHPRTALLVIEVANTSVEFDRAVKAAVYARAEIPEYWIVNVPERSIEVFRDVDSNAGRYRTLITARDNVRVSAANLPGLELTANGLFDT